MNEARRKGESVQRGQKEHLSGDTAGAGLTRRKLLHAAGWAIAAAAVPVSRLWAAEASPLMKKLSAYISEARNVAVPADVAEKAKHHILDTFAAMISGSALAPGRAAINFARHYGGEAIATVVASNILCGPLEAALANGVLAHSDETDDAHAPSLSHPGCAAVPAALAMGEKLGVSGAAFLRGVTLGYDLGPRVVAALGGAPLQGEGHRSTHSISGIFAAAAAAASLANLDAQRMRWALDYASQQCSGIAAWQRDTGHMEKGFVYGGMPARGGVTAALLAASGWTGVDDVFSGADNFLEANALKANPGALVDQLGERYEIALTDIKKWTVGAPIQAPLDALEAIQKRRRFSAGDVRQVTVRIASSAAKIVDNREMPDVCLQHLFAVMLLDKTASFQAAHDAPRMKDPEILRQRAKVQLLGDAELERLMPRREAIVEVILNDGAKLTERVEAVRGTPANPMTREEVSAKARELISPVLGAGAASKLIQRIFEMEKIKDIRELRPQLQKS